MIESFTGKYRWLSNFYPCDVLYGDDHYPSVEHAYQAAKTISVRERGRIRRLKSPGQAKRLGQTFDRPSDWDQVKVGIMRSLLRSKFRGLELRRKLIETGGEELIEGNSWGDTFWGVDQTTGLGDNHLGRLLMQVREEVRRGSRPR